MSVEIKIPDVGESIQEVQIAQWLKREGDPVEEDESVVELETDKASVEVPAPASGVLSKIVKDEGEQVSVGEVIGYIEEGEAGESEDESEKEQAAAAVKEKKAAESGNGRRKKSEKKTKVATKEAAEEGEEAEPSEQTVAAHDRRREEHDGKEKASKNKKDADKEPRRQEIRVTPSARRALREHDLTAEDVPISGKRLRREDVLRHVERMQEQAKEDPRERGEAAPEKERREAAAPKAEERPSMAARPDRDLEEIVPMSLLRRRIAQRLVAAQQEAALLSTFNEIDMTAVKQLRAEHGERFQKRYGVKLGMMGFFVKAVVDALKQYPDVNAEIRNKDQIVYRNYYHIGIAIGGGRGLVVPVLRHAQRMSFAEIEAAIGDFADRAQRNKLQPQELEGGTFTISNGGVYGSLLSTPLVNPPQSGVLGMHAIHDRPVAREGQVVVRPMMYVALSYDHRIIDGREAVNFLKRIKEAIEDPARMLIEV